MPRSRKVLDRSVYYKPMQQNGGKYGLNASETDRESLRNYRLLSYRRISLGWSGQLLLKELAILRYLPV